MNRQPKKQKTHPMKPEIKLERGIPMPETRNKGVRDALKAMRVGDSFLKPDTYAEKNFRVTTWIIAKKLGIRVAVRRSGTEGLRCWRIE